MLVSSSARFEYRVDYVDEAKPPSYTICVVGAVADVLYTFASRVPEAVRPAPRTHAAAQATARDIVRVTLRSA